MPIIKTIKPIKTHPIGPKTDPFANATKGAAKVLAKIRARPAKASTRPRRNMSRVISILAGYLPAAIIPFKTSVIFQREGLSLVLGRKIQAHRISRCGDRRFRRDVDAFLGEEKGSGLTDISE